jgi:HlyD family secretion protein
MSLEIRMQKSNSRATVTKSLIVAVIAAKLMSGVAFADTAVATTTAAAEPPAPPSISVLVAEKKPIAENLTVTGSFAAGELVLVTPEVEGLSVTEILAEEGDTVVAGQVLARLSASQTDIQIAQTKANLARNDAALLQAKNQIVQAKINADRAIADLNRTKKLRTSGVSSIEQFDQRQAAYDLAVSQLDAANLGLEVAKADRVVTEAQMADLELRKSRTEIKAPVAGYISRRTVQIGGIASASRDAMFNIVANGTVKLLAEVPESDLPRVKLDQKASIVVNGLDKPIEGIVKLISPEVNETTRIGLVHIRVADGVRIPLGSFGRAQIALAAADGVALPLTAVTFGENGTTVQIVKDGKVVVRKVITGLVGTNDIEITDGVSAGETFVAKAGSFVRDGDFVTPVKLDTAVQ